MRTKIAFVGALLVVGCAKPEPPPPPPPAPPVFEPIPVKPQEELSIQGRSQPAGPGKQAVAILVNGERVIDGVITTSAPRKSFHGKYKEHQIDANCTLKERVDCEILVDGAAESSTSGHERP